MHEHENDNRAGKQVFCIPEEDFVDVQQHCSFCEFWDGKMCKLYDTGHITWRRRWTLPWIVRLHRRINRRLARLRGRRIRLPRGLEEWSRNELETEGSLPLDDEGDYGAVELFDAEESVRLEQRKKKKKKDKDILPELIKEYWDVNPDVPDWGSGQDSVPPPDPGSSSGLLPEDSLPELLPPDTGIGPEPGIENRPDDVPGFPPDIGGGFP